jgi:hypothetical protein
MPGAWSYTCIWANIPWSPQYAQVRWAMDMSVPKISVSGPARALPSVYWSVTVSPTFRSAEALALHLAGVVALGAEDVGTASPKPFGAAEAPQGGQPIPPRADVSLPSSWWQVCARWASSARTFSMNCRTSS